MTSDNICHAQRTMTRGRSLKPLFLFLRIQASKHILCQKKEKYSSSIILAKTILKRKDFPKLNFDKILQQYKPSAIISEDYILIYGLSAFQDHPIY